MVGEGCEGSGATRLVGLGITRGSGGGALGARGMAGSCLVGWAGEGGEAERSGAEGVPHCGEGDVG